MGHRLPLSLRIKTDVIKDDYRDEANSIDDSHTDADIEANGVLGLD